MATFGTFYLNLAGRLPVHPAAGAFGHLSAHAEAVTFLALAVTGAALAITHVTSRRRERMNPASHGVRTH